MPGSKWSPERRAKFAATIAAKHSPKVKNLFNPHSNKVKAKAGVTFQFSLGDQIVTARIISVNHRRARMEDLI